MVANLAGRCARSTTGKNLIQIGIDTGLDPWVTQGWKVRAAVPRSEVPEGDGWRQQYLGKLIGARQQMEVGCEDTSEVDILIESLCST